MRVGDKIVCINTDGLTSSHSLRYLTLNKVYTVVNIQMTNPGIINDNGEKAFYHSSRFITVGQRRDLLISQLGI